MKITFPSNYLKAADLSGKPVTVTIRDIRTEEVGPTRDKKHVAYFDELPKPMVMNKVNLKKIIEQFGDESDDWVGRQIVLYEAMVEFQGETVPALRVRLTKTKPASYIYTEPSEERLDEPDTSLSPQLESERALIIHAEEMAKHGPIIYRSWVEGRNNHDKAVLERHLGRLWALANKHNPDIPQLSEEAKRKMK